jgi:hypothetical protein
VEKFQKVALKHIEIKHVGKILISLKRPGTRCKTLQGHMVLSGLQHTGKKSVTSSKPCRDSQALSRRSGDSRPSSNTQGFISPAFYSQQRALARLKYSYQAPQKTVKMNILINTTTTTSNYNVAVVGSGQK